MFKYILPLFHYLKNECGFESPLINYFRPRLPILRLIKICAFFLTS